MPFGRLPKGYSEPGEGDQKNVIKQMKVRTIIKDDSSWIHKPDDTEGQTIELPPSKEPSSTAPPVVTPQKDRPPAPKPSSGYIIRGIFTKPTDSTSVPQTRYSATSEPPKRPTVPAKPVTANLPRTSPSAYKVASEEYKKKIPTVPAKPVTANLPRTSPSAYKVASEEYKKKMAEASCNVFQRSATWERSSVLSDAKKSAMPAAQVASFCPPSKSSTQDVAPPVMAETVEVEEDEVPPERSQTLPSLARQIFGFTSSDSSREKAGSSAWTGNVSRSFFSSARVQEYSRKKEETHTAVGHDPKLESSLLELSLDSSGKRSSTCSTDSNRSSSGSQNDLDEIQITSKKKSTLSYGDRYVSSTESYEGPDNQQFFEANKPRYASASIVTSTEKRYGSSASSDEPTSSKLQRFASATREKAIMGSMAASAPDSASASDNEQPSNFSKISGASCTHCLKEIRTGPKITLEHLGTCFHECCFKCEICEKIMANMLDHVYIHKGIIHCDQCYARLF